MPTLIVTLPASLPSATTPCTTVLADNDGTVLRHGQTPLSLFPEVNGGEIIAVVPAAQLSWHHLDLPKGTLDRGLFQDGNAARLRSVLDGLLEERLLDEPEQLHYAIEPQARAGAPVWVAACNRAWLHAWLQTLEQAGMPIARIVPEIAPPTNVDSAAPILLAVGTADAPQLLCSSPTGVSVLPLTAASVALLAPLLNAASPADIVSEPAVAAQVESFFSGRVRIETEAQRALVSAQSSWDLAQFDLLRTRRARTQKRLSTFAHALWRAPQWKPARWAVCALVATNLVGLQAWAWREQASLVAKKASIREVLTTTFPEVRVVVDAPLQMERSLANLQRQSGAASSADLEAMLGRFQAVAVELPTPTAIEFIAGELRLKIPTALDGQLPGLVSRLQPYGYAVQLRDDTLMIKQDKRP